MRPLLFGDLPIADWPRGAPAEQAGPWADFAVARECERSGRHDEAVAIWRRLTTEPDIESRHVLQAWQFLRAAGVRPDPTVAPAVLGAVAEVAVGDQHDLLVAYRNGGVRYLNWSGKVAIVEQGNVADVDAAAAAWLAVADVLATVVGVSEQGVLPALPTGHSRVLMLTPGGKRFGQGADHLLRSDQLAADFLTAATRLLIAVTRAPEKSS